MTDADRSVIGGRYQVIASLGKGGMGVVYKAYDPVLDRTVALKKMIATVVDSEEGRQRFYIEARAAARLNHPNIVTIHELEEYSGDIYIVMELLDGVSLANFMRQRVHMPIAGYLTILAQVADGLHYAHKRAIVHRDVKPPNLVLTPSGAVKILDFGIARLASNEITRKGKLLGTPHYMAPEQVLAQSVDARADLFSLGAVAYELVTGVKAFTADSIPALLMQITSTAHRPVLEVAPETDPALAAIIDRLLAKNRELRFLTGMEVVAALDLIGEIDRIDLVADAVSAVMGPSGDATIYAPIGSTPSAVAATPSTPAFELPDTIVPPPLPVGGAPFSSSPPRLNIAAVPAAPEVSAAPIAPAPASPVVDAPAAASAQADTLPDIQAPSVTLGTMIGAPSPIAASSPLPEAAAATTSLPPPVSPRVPADTGAPPASSAPQPVAASAAKTPGASTPRGFVNPGVPQPKHRSGAGTAIVVVGLLLLPAIVATGWWAYNSVRRTFQQGTTATDTTSPSAVRDADPATQKPTESPAVTTDQPKPGETPADPASPSQEPAQTPPAVEANATPVPSPESADPAKPADATQPAADANPANANPADANKPAPTNQPPANQPGASQVADANRPAQPNQAPGANQAPANANQARVTPPPTTPPSANQGDARNVAPPARETVTDRTRETSPDTVVRDPSTESSRLPGRDAPPRENARSVARDTTRDAPRETPRDSTPARTTPSEPAPPVREEPPPTEPSREPSTPADTRALDYGSLSAFRGGSRGTGSASNVYSDSPSTAAAVARITYALEAYGDAIAARDLEALRDVRSPVTPGEAALLKEGRTTVRFSNLDVSLNGNDARVRCRRALVTNGKTVSSSPADVRLTRRPEGWVITEIR